MGNGDDYLTGAVGEFHDHHYPNIFAGGDPNEALNTLWYHDHRGDFTAQNTYKGLVGMCLQFDANRVDQLVPLGATEEWTLRNMSEDWEHPVHIHLEEHQIVTRHGKKPPKHERGRKDVTVIGPGEEVVLRIKTRDWTGRYPLHCHNTVHEDHAMMIRWDVVDFGDDDDD
jgi:FtsP/CotA-like multicopper oxidase with cupredoxin domain